jgi:hypothetical protein
MHLRHVRLVIISGSCLFHLILLLLIFILYHSPVSTPFLKVAGEKPFETLFYDAPAANPAPEIPENSKSQEPWAQLLPQAGSLASSLADLDQEPLESTDKKLHVLDSTSDSPLPISDTIQSITNTMQNLEQRIEEADSLDTIHSTILKNDRANTQEPDSSQKKSSKKQEAQSALARMTRGYVQQLTDEGTNLIKTIGGDPHAMPTAQQLRIERYLAKLQWCLQNAHVINKESCENKDSIQAIMKLYFTVNRQGLMADFRIVQTSGYDFIDRYITHLFKFASSSFPPLPEYIQENPYPLLYTVNVNLEGNSPYRIGLARH